MKLTVLWVSFTFLRGCLSWKFLSLVNTHFYIIKIHLKAIPLKQSSLQTRFRSTTYINANNLKIIRSTQVGTIIRTLITKRIIYTPLEHVKTHVVIRLLCFVQPLFIGWSMPSQPSQPHCKKKLSKWGKCPVNAEVHLFQTWFHEVRNRGNNRTSNFLPTRLGYMRWNERRSVPSFSYSAIETAFYFMSSHPTNHKKKY